MSSSRRLAFTQKQRSSGKGLTAPFNLCWVDGVQKYPGMVLCCISRFTNRIVGMVAQHMSAHRVQQRTCRILSSTPPWLILSPNAQIWHKLMTYDDR
jgi:hypothetical protein